MKLKKIKTPFISDSDSVVYFCIAAGEVWFEDEYSQLDSLRSIWIAWAAEYIKNN